MEARNPKPNNIAADELKVAFLPVGVLDNGGSEGRKGLERGAGARVGGCAGRRGMEGGGAKCGRAATNACAGRDGGEPESEPAKSEAEGITVLGRKRPGADI
jgi:hypothetical protein